MNLFKQSIPLQALVILLAAVALWIGAILTPQPMPQPEGGAVLYGLVYNLLSGTPRLAVVIALILVIAEAATFNLIIANNGLTSQNSLLPTLMFIICMSAPATTLTPMVLVNALMVACLFQLTIRGSLLTIPLEKACAATMLIGVASMFYPPSALMLISYLLVAINYRLYNWRDWFVLILGFIAPYFIVATVLMFTDGLAGWWESGTSCFDGIDLVFERANTLQNIGSTIMIIALLAGVVSVFSRSSESTMIWQKNAGTILYMIVGGIFMLAFSRIYPTDMQLFPLTFAFGTSCLLMPTKKLSRPRGRKNRDWIYTVILVLIIAAAFIC